MADDEICAGCGQPAPAESADVRSALQTNWHTSCLRIFHPGLEREAEAENVLATGEKKPAREGTGAFVFVADADRPPRSLDASQLDVTRGQRSASTATAPADVAAVSSPPRVRSRSAGRAADELPPTVPVRPVLVARAASGESEPAPPPRAATQHASAALANAVAVLAIPAPEWSRECPKPAFYSEDLLSIVTRLKVMGLVRDRVRGTKTYPFCVVGSEVVDFLVHSGQCRSRQEAVKLGARMVAAGMLWHVQDAPDFRDSSFLYGVARGGTALGGLQSVGSVLTHRSLLPRAPPSSSSLATSDSARSSGSALVPTAFSDAGDAGDAAPHAAAGQQYARAADVAAAARTLDPALGTWSRVPLKEGFLIKQGGRVKSWKRRWFVLRVPMLEYYKSRDTRKPLGQLDLRACWLDKAEDSRSPLCFMLCTEGRAYLLEAENTQDFLQWLKAIDQAHAILEARLVEQG